MESARGAGAIDWRGHRECRQREEAELLNDFKMATVDPHSTDREFLHEILHVEVARAAVIH